MRKVTIQDAEDSIDIELEDLENSLEDQGYGVLILPPGTHFFAFWSDDRSILLKGHEMRERIEKEGPKCGYVLHRAEEE